MKKDDLINEGELIQQGLERFLQEELAGMSGDHDKEKKSVETKPAQQVEQEMIERARGRVEDPPGSQTGNRRGEVTQTPVRRLEEHVVDDLNQRREVRSRNESLKRNNPQADYRRQARKKKTSHNKEKDIKGKRMEKRKKSSTLKGFLTFLLVLVLVAAAGLYFLVGSVYNKMDYERVDQLASEPMKEDGVTNILLIGNDSRSQGEDGRSDAMILLSISKKTKKIHMTSLLRDMYVEIPGRDGNRLNAAYAYGGPTLLLETIEQNLGIKVNRYVLVNFQAFANLVDAVEGVDLELSNEEVKWVNAYLNEYNLLEGRDIKTDYLDESLSGMIHLNGPQALAYCRNRYIGSDFERTNRQRKVIAAVVAKLPVALASNSGELVEGLFPQLTTNLTQSECYSLSLQASKFLTYEMVQSSIPIEGSYKNTTIRQMSVLEVDYEKNKEFIRQNIYGDE